MTALFLPEYITARNSSLCSLSPSLCSSGIQLFQGQRLHSVLLPSHFAHRAVSPPPPVISGFQADKPGVSILSTWCTHLACSPSWWRLPLCIKMWPTEPLRGGEKASSYGSEGCDGLFCFQSHLGKCHGRLLLFIFLHQEQLLQTHGKTELKNIWKQLVLLWSNWCSFGALSWVVLPPPFLGFSLVCTAFKFHLVCDASLSWQ